MKEYLTFQDLVAYELAGITEISANEPINRFPIQSSVMEEVVVPVENIEIPDNKLSHINTLSELHSEIINFDDCYLKKTATNTVFGDGNTTAKIMIIGDAPGTEEDKKGTPFVGNAGVLLDKILESIGLSREKNCYLTNLVPWRPPGNRPPSPSEIMTCLPFLKKQIEIIKPEIIICLGVLPLNALVQTNLSITKARGQWFDYKSSEGSQEINIFVTYNPTFLLRSPAQKKSMWNDIITLKKFLEKNKY